MTVSVNGKMREVTAVTVADLIGLLNLPSERIALERNLEIVSRSAWAQTAIAEGDKFEIVQFVGGG